MANRPFLRTSGWALVSSLSLAGCSLLNSFGDSPVDADGSGGSGLGGADGTGGVVGTGGSDDGVGGVLNTDPGLVVVGGNLEGDTDQPVLLALSPQSGEELARLEGTYDAVAHEATRDIWFLIQGDKVRAAKFNRTSNKWEMLGKEATVVVPLDTLQVFAMNGKLGIVDGAAVLSAFDTTDLDAITLLDTAPYPTAAGNTVWGAVGVPNSKGGTVHILGSFCNGVDPCSIQLTRIQIDLLAAQVVGPTTLDTMSVLATTSIGSIAYDMGGDQLVVVVPSLDGEASGQSVLWTASTKDQPGEQFTLTQESTLPRWAAVDPCQSVVYVRSPQENLLRAGGLVVDALRLEMERNVGVTGQQGLFFEPYTRSLLLVQASGDEYGIDAWEVIGTTLTPNVKKRLTNWKTPNVQPTFVKVALPVDAVCE